MPSWLWFLLLVVVALVAVYLLMRSRAAGPTGRAPKATADPYDVTSGPSGSAPTAGGGSAGAGQASTPSE
ncbi:MAG: hypothetical protein M3Y71_19055, partial [Actinomycetota bacterium]|nr:hypothetical protein [Actinomycetota bacterium]